MAIWDPNLGEPSVYHMLALPFGASRFVYSFLRVAHCLWWMAVTALRVCWSFYYDDYVSLSPAELASHTDHCISAFFYMLGWDFSSDGEKRTEFSQIFGALGVTVDMSSCLDGCLRIANTQKRVAALLEFLSRVLEEGALSKPIALKLRGRLQFADGQLLGRVGRLCLKAVTEHAYGNTGAQISDQCRAALVRFSDMLRHSLPRMVLARRQEPLYMFTDASYEPSNATWPCGIGGALFNTVGRPVGAFSSPIRSSLKRQLGENTKRTIIFEAELTAILCGLMLWAEQLSHAPVVVYVDNNSARDIAISGAARSKTANDLLEVLLGIEMQAGVTAWYQRVPSPSNIADEPSRELCSELSLNGQRVYCSEVTRILEDIEKCMSAKKG